MDDVKAAFIVGVLQVVDPAKGLLGFIGQRGDQSVFRAKFEQALELFPERRGASLFEGQDLGPLVAGANGEDRTAGIEGISPEAKACLGELFF